MKILSIQGYFGNLCGKCVEFGEGFTTSVLPNGWGKTTLCAFLRVMIYGLNTAKRDTQDTLSDKSRYLPQDGKPMSGRMTVRHQNRVIIITRATGKGGLMQAFDAFYEDTSEKCTFLNAKNCGEVLLGMGEDAFLSSVFIEGAQLMRPSDELQGRMISMAQTGDTQARAAEALGTLDRWRLDLDSGNGHGVIPTAEKDLAETHGVLRRLGEAETDIAAERARAGVLIEEENAAQVAYEKVYCAYATETTGGAERLDALIEESQKLIRMLEERTPPEPMLRAATDALYGYEGAARLEREKRERLPGGDSRYQQALDELEEERHEYEIAHNRAAEPHIRWVPLVLALVLASASAATFLLDIDWGQYTAYVPWALSALAVVGLIAAFWGCVKRSELPERDFAVERRELLRLRRSEDVEQDTASVVLRDAYDALMHAARAIQPAVSAIEEAEQVVRQAQDDLQAMRREEAALQELLVQRKHIPEGGETRKTEVEQLREALAAARGRADAARKSLAQLEGRASALGDREKIEQEAARFEALRTEAVKRRAAVCTAIEEVKGAQAELSARVSPQITEKAQGFMEFLTEGIYEEVRLDSALRARAATDGGQLLDALRLSAGTRDQLYLALRLAVAEVLDTGEEPAPIILDDPFLTFDDARTKRALEMLHGIAKRRQVILFSCRAFK